jgi:2-C-methyl-D-erythritol 4-phosphate cytidylyltransferase
MVEPVIHALLPAAGKGQRFGDALLKQYVPVAGKPVLAHAIESFGAQPLIAGITVVLADDDELFEEVIGRQYPDVHTARGGATRAQSVLNGLKSIRKKFPETEWVVVHDAARPCLPGDCLRRLLLQGREHPDGAILAVPVRDTLKRSDGSGRVESTVNREGLWAAQTPQLFPLQRLIGAIEDSLGAGRVPTDEAAAMERTGARPLLVMGSSANVKITYPDDIQIVETWLSGCGERIW